MEGLLMTSIYLKGVHPSLLQILLLRASFFFFKNHFWFISSGGYIHISK